MPAPPELGAILADASERRDPSDPPTAVDGYAAHGSSIEDRRSSR